MSLEFILQLADGTCYDGLSCLLVDRDPDSFLSTSWTYVDGWKLLLHDAYYTTPSTTQNPLTPCLSQDSASIFVIYLWLEVLRQWILAANPQSNHPSNIRLSSVESEGQV